MKRILLIAITFFILNLPLITAAEVADQIQAESPWQLAERFCKLDFDGARLRADTYDQAGIGTFTIPGKHRSPGWDHSVLVATYKIEKLTQNENEATVTVTYDVVGAIYRDLIRKNKKEFYVFHFKRQNAGWFMVEPYDLPQHISVSAAVKHWEYLLQVQGEAVPNTKVIIKKLQKFEETVSTSLKKGGQKNPAPQHSIVPYQFD